MKPHIDISLSENIIFRVYVSTNKVAIEGSSMK